MLTGQLGVFHLQAHTDIQFSHIFIFRDDITNAICQGRAVHPCQVHSEGELGNSLPLLRAVWATGAGRARGMAEQLPAAMWLTLFKPE